MYHKIIRPFLFKFDPEKIHNELCFFIKCLQESEFLTTLATFPFRPKKNPINLLNIEFKNKVGLAAGFDKNGEMLPFLSGLGFGHVEIGSVTALPTGGNTKPRLFRLIDDQAIINRMGLNNLGAFKVSSILGKYNYDKLCPVGINIAKTPWLSREQGIKDILSCNRLLYGFSKYINLNTSCPNVEDTTFKDSGCLRELLTELRKDLPQGKKLFVKISADETDLDTLINTSIDCGVNGFVISNTTKIKENPHTEKGGLSGLPLKNKSTELIKIAHTITEGKFPIIGVGGIFSKADMLEKIDAGASLVQIYTGFIYEGPGILKKLINK